MTLQEKWKSYKRILCIRTDNAGDVLMTEPALRAIKYGCTHRTIDLLCSNAGQAAASLIPYIDHTLITEPIWNPGKSHNTLDMATRISHRAYDAAIIFNVYSQSPLPAAMLCHLAGIPDVAAFCRENPYGLIPSWFPDLEPIYTIRHEIDRQLLLAARLGCTIDEHSIKVNIDASTQGKISSKIKFYKPFILVHPGVSELKRQYPPALMVDAIRAIKEQTGIHILLGGSKTEIDLCTWIANQIGDGIENVAGKFSFDEYAALIKQAELLIANNTGPVHIAEAVNTPVIVLYAQTNPQHVPRQKKSIVLPFDIPEDQRSQNILIKYAHEQSFSKASMVDADKILNTVNALLKKNETHYYSDSNI